ncbi:MAG: hypothetical protein R3E83_16850 [Burkholderiaceae bacterium]
MNTMSVRELWRALLRRARRLTHADRVTVTTRQAHEPGVRDGGAPGTLLRAQSADADARLQAESARLRAELAHDLRQPLQVISLLAREAALEHRPAQAGQLLAGLAEAADDLNLRITRRLATDEGAVRALARVPAKATPARVVHARDQDPPPAHADAPDIAPVATAGEVPVGFSGPAEVVSFAASADSHAQVMPDGVGPAGTDQSGDSHARASTGVVDSVLLLDAHAGPRQAMAHALTRLGVEVRQAASAREAIAALVTDGDRLPSRILVNARLNGEPIQPTLMGIGHALRVRVPIVVLTGDLTTSVREPANTAWRELGVVARAGRPRSLAALRSLLLAAA